MKIVAIVIGSLVLLVGIFVGLLFAHVIPASGLAASSPAAASALGAMGLYKPKVPPKRVVLAKGAALSTAPASGPTAADLGAEKAQLDAEKSDLAQQKAQMEADAAQKIPSTSAMSAPLSPKLTAIYDTMSADDLARIFAKQPDSIVAQALGAMDEKRAGKAMAVLPPDRVAKIAVLLNQSNSSQQASSSVGGSAPQSGSSATQPLARIQ